MILLAHVNILVHFFYLVISDGYRRTRLMHLSRRIKKLTVLENVIRWLTNINSWSYQYFYEWFYETPQLLGKS